ncbi:response regulator [Oxalobacteraceae bacterium R-40]|uniref:Response regulator n=1 Tax=Keguizhuia sedimenti TaxID=3064264 RepID=A0ABU1BS64_9BURK|nr:response regulator [Oxalobacteraceae bacterium R-40]
MNKPVAEGRKKLILIVDDEFDLTSTFSLLFELNGFETVTANNGHQALEVMKQRLPDLILSDYMMPVMDGVELSRHIRANPVTEKIPIVLMSAIPQHRDLIDRTFSAFIQKPFQFKNLLDMTLDILSKQDVQGHSPR